jgi:hypothetical protein
MDLTALGLLLFFLPTFLLIVHLGFLLFLLLFVFTFLLDTCLDWALDTSVTYEIEVFFFRRFVVYGVLG